MARCSSRSVKRAESTGNYIVQLRKRRTGIRRTLRQSMMPEHEAIQVVIQPWVDQLFMTEMKRDMHKSTSVRDVRSNYNRCPTPCPLPTLRAQVTSS